MKLAWTLFALLLALCAVVIYLLLLPEPPGAGATVHPLYETMQRSGDAATRSAPVLAAGWILGLLEIAFFVALLALGARHHEELGAIRTSLLVGLGLFAGVFSAMVVAYRGYVGEAQPELVLAFPRPSTWMLYGLWPVPLYFLLLYVLRFDRWILSRQQLDAFHRIVARRRERGEGH